ncbi:type IV secretory system conjugative DNA transfer family protein, partial [Brevibacillus sp. 179-C8.2 HS]
NAVLLLKRLYGDDADLLHIVRALRNLKTLKEHITDYERKYRRDDLVEFFQVEVFDSENFTKISTGLRMQLEDLVGNELVLKLLTKKKDESVRFEDHLANGGVVLINSALGELGNLSSIFGQFAIMTFQNAVFRRPGNQWTRRPHYTFIDELPEYLNPDFRRLLTLGRKYRNACTIAIQNISQLKV